MDRASSETQRSARHRLKRTATRVRIAGAPAGDAEVDPVLVRVLRLVVELKAVLQLVRRVAAHGVDVRLVVVGRHNTPTAGKVKLQKEDKGGGGTEAW